MKKLLYHIDLYPDEKTHYPNAALLLEDGKVVEILENYQDALGKYEQLDGKGLIALPGFIDVHCHGGYGYDFLKQPKEAVKNFSKQCGSEGCTAYLASLVAEEHEILLAALNQYAQIDSGDHPQCLGVHLEGPFLNTKYQAVMRQGTLRNPDLVQFKQLVDAANGHVVDMTIAPELEGADLLLQYAKEKGIHIMIGHSDASLDQAKQAIEKGAIGLTHLYNAMSPHSHRNPGLVTAGLYLKGLICELITDGFHIRPEVIDLTYQVIGASRLAIITDSTLIKGLEDGEYYFSGNHVQKQGIHAVSLDNGRLAGSVVSMIDCVKNMLKYTACGYNNIVQMACINPSRIANVENYKGKLLKGYDADVVLLNQNQEVEMTFVKGKVIYEKC